MTGEEIDKWMGEALIYQLNFTCDDVVATALLRHPLRRGWVATAEFLDGTGESAQSYCSARYAAEALAHKVLSAR